MQSTIVAAVLTCLLCAPGAIRSRGFPLQQGGSTLAWQFQDPDLIAEDLAFDAARDRFLVTSARKGGVYATDRSGSVSRWIAPDSVTWGTFAIAVDARRNTLWVTTASFPGTARYTAADSARSMLLEYDLQSGALRRRIAPSDLGPHALGDLTLGADGTLYLSDGFGGAVYVLSPGAGSLRALVAPRTFRSPQTPALTADGRQIYVADYARGIALIDVRDGQWRWLAPADSVNLKGTDGLYRSGNELIAVQNGRPPGRIIRLALRDGDRLDLAAIIIAGGDATDLNHAFVKGDSLYFIARSGWDRMAEDGRFTPGTAAQAPQLRRMPR